MEDFRSGLDRRTARDLPPVRIPTAEVCQLQSDAESLREVLGYCTRIDSPAPYERRLAEVIDHLVALAAQANTPPAEA